jgi:CrcB protein
MLGSAFPYGTLTVNVLGSFLIAVVSQLGANSDFLSPTARIALASGLVGGFTTYSAFNLETLDLISTGSWKLASLNVTLTLASCLAAGLLGAAVTRAMLR